MTPEGADEDRSPEYVCEHCRYQGRDPMPVDEVQCPMCGEPVTPLRQPQRRRPQQSGRSKAVIARRP